MDANNQAPRKFGNKLFSILSILTASLIMTGCATNLQQNDDETSSITSNPSERVAIKYNKSSNNNLPPEVSAFLNEGRISSKFSTVTPTRIGKGNYNHEILNNAKATDIVAINPHKFAPPIALPDYGINDDNLDENDNLQIPVDYVAQAPAYFAAVQPQQFITRSKSYASIKTVEKPAYKNMKKNVVVTQSVSSRKKFTISSTSHTATPTLKSKHKNKK